MKIDCHCVAERAYLVLYSTLTVSDSADLFRLARHSKVKPETFRGFNPEFAPRFHPARSTNRKGTSKCIRRIGKKDRGQNRLFWRERPGLSARGAAQRLPRVAPANTPGLNACILAAVMVCSPAVWLLEHDVRLSGHSRNAGLRRRRRRV